MLEQLITRYVELMDMFYDKNKLLSSPTNPTPTDPDPTDPTPTNPTPTDPTLTEPTPTNPVIPDVNVGGCNSSVDALFSVLLAMIVWKKRK
jgi:hypothetical protein